MKIFKINSKTWVVRLGMMCVLSILLSSCLKTNYIPVNYTPAARVAFIQASPDQPPLDLYFDNNKVNPITVNYGNVIDYFRAYTGKRNIHFYAQGTMNQIYGDTLTLTKDINYSLFLANKPNNPEIVLLKDTLSQPAAGNAGIRFVNMSPDSPPASLAIQNLQVLATNIPYKGSTSFMPIPGNTTYDFVIRQGTTNTVLVTFPGIRINSGFVYTIWFHGLVASTGTDDKLSADIMTNAFYYY